MSCPTVLPTGLNCPSSYSGFVYSGQSFTTNVIARNAAGVTTQNYDGTANTTPNFAKGVTLTAWDGVGSITTPNPPAAPPGSILSGGTILSSSFSKGSTVSPGTSGVPTYTFGTTPTSPTNIYVRAVDADSVSSRQATPTNSIEGGVMVVSGRMKIANASGSELLSLPINLTVQYWNGSDYSASTNDNNTVLTSGNIVVGPTYQRKSISDNWTTSVATFANGTTTGTWTGTLSKPNGTFTGRGSVPITTNAPTYLPSTTGIATFGVYTGNKNLIYMRENY